MFEGVLICGQEFQPSLHARVVLGQASKVLERLIVGPNLEVSPAQVPSQAFDCPYDGACLEVEGSPVPFRVEGAPADEDDGSYRSVGLLLFECGAQTVQASIAVQTKGSCAVLDRFPVREDEVGRCS